MSKATNDFSVLIPAFRAGRTILETLQSVAAQTERPRELLVYEDGRFDDLAATVTTFAATVPFPVKLLGVAVNAGVSRARNALLCEASGEFIAFLDADDIWTPDHLARCGACFAAGADVAFSGVTFIDAEGQPLPGRGEPSAEQLADIAPSLFRYNFVQCTSSLCVRRSLLDRVGNFDIDLSHGEDLDLWLRLLMAGARWRYSGRCTCAYRKHATSAMAQTYLVAERMAAFYEKHLNNPLIPRSARRRALISNRRVYARLNWRRRPVDAAGALRRLMQLQPWHPAHSIAWFGVTVWSRFAGSEIPPAVAPRRT